MELLGFREFMGSVEWMQRGKKNRCKTLVLQRLLFVFAKPNIPFGLVKTLAEDEGFKPPIPERGIPDFESSAFDHSANLPNAVQR